jgi:transcription-repair coupling factor (superfamily II helicase)
VARLRLLCRHYGVTELAATATGSAATLRVAPLTLADSAQVRLARMYPAARYRATTAAVQVPIPRATDAVGAPRIRDRELVQMAVDLLLALDGRPKGEIDITTFTPGGKEAAR